MKTTRWASLLSMVALATALSACGAALPPPNDQVAATQGAVSAAEEAGANQDPEAQLYLKLAKEQLDKARELMAGGENERADRLLRRAEADADLARGLARAKAAQAAAEEARKTIANMSSVDK